MKWAGIEKYVSVTIALVSMALAGVSLVAIDNDKVAFFLFEDKNTLALFVGLLSSLGAAFASFILMQTVRRNRLRSRARRVFIIYSHEDAQLAEKVTATLRDGRVEPWLDKEQIVAGEIWKDAITKGLDESAMAIVLITENTAKSEFAMSEIKNAIRNMEASDKVTSPVIPVVFDNATVPPQLAHIHYVDMSRKDANEFLVTSVHKAMDRVVSEASMMDTTANA